MQRDLDVEISSARTQLVTLTNQGEEIRKNFIFRNYSISKQLVLGKN